MRHKMEASKRFASSGGGPLRLNSVNSSLTLSALVRMCFIVVYFLPQQKAAGGGENPGLGSGPEDPAV